MTLGNSPWTSSGYGQQMRIFLPRLANLGHTMAITCFYGLEGGLLNMGDFLCYPKRLHPYGNDVIVPHSAAFGADIMISLMDTWVMNPEDYPKPMKWCVPAGTLVTMADGTIKPIEEIQEGDMVVSDHAPMYRPFSLVASRVKKAWKIPAKASGEIIEITTESGECLEVTAENAIAVHTKAGFFAWQDASCLVPGDMVYCFRCTPYNKGNSDNDKANTRDTEYRDRPDGEMASGVIAGRSSLCGGDYRWGRIDLDPARDETQTERTSLYRAPESVCVEHQPRAFGMVTPTTWDGGQLQIQTTGEIQEHPSPRMDFTHQRLSMLLLPESDRTLSDHKEGIGAFSDGVYREPTNERPDNLQSAIFGTGNRDLVEGSVYEPQRIVSVSRKGRPYEYVYDITTEDGNFFAGGILIHNCPWYPVDHDPMPALVRGKISLAYKRISFSQHGVKATHDAGLDCFFVPHGIEVNILKPMDKTECRNRIGIPLDKYIVGTVAMNKGNPSRKCFCEMMEAFARFHSRHPDTLYLLQTEKGEGIEGMINMPELVRNMGLIEGQDVIFCNQYQQVLGFPPEYMADLYNCLDVHLITTRGEGFGLPVLESQACGVPVITGGWTATKELFFAGQLLDPEKDAEREYSGLASYQWRPRVSAIEAALEAEYQHHSDTTEAVKKAQEYDADYVTEHYWRPVLEEIEKELKQ